MNANYQANSARNVEKNADLAQKLTDLLDDPTLTVDQKTKIIGKLAALTNATMRAESSERGKRRTSPNDRKGDCCIARFSPIARIWPDDWTQERINEAAYPIQRESQRLAMGGLITYPSYYVPVMSPDTQQAFERT
ncbi:hypothetical protein [Aeromonas caviae]|uniref:hypothetical protein n=1 Tax=Aeromonas caviae TaxID=648 RepID=UPI002B488828|nr:hypothetical protein [Aeromonas caviae]